MSRVQKIIGIFCVIALFVAGTWLFYIFFSKSFEILSKEAETVHDFLIYSGKTEELSCTIEDKQCTYADNSVGEIRFSKEKSNCFLISVDDEKYWVGVRDKELYNSYNIGDSAVFIKCYYKNSEENSVPSTEGNSNYKFRDVGYEILTKGDSTVSGF